MKTKIIILTLVFLIGGISLVAYFKNAPSHTIVQQDKKISYWTCPMHSQVHKDGPGSCPICGMNLVPVFAEATHEANETGVLITPDKGRLIGLGTIQIEQMPDNNITIPKSALIDKGSEKYVYVSSTENRFIQKPVVTGETVGGDIVVTQGLSAGDKLVINGTFMVDAEYQLKGLRHD